MPRAYFFDSVFCKLNCRCFYDLSPTTLRGIGQYRSRERSRAAERSANVDELFVSITRRKHRLIDAEESRNLSAFPEFDLERKCILRTVSNVKLESV
jgi:hypothetical protein